VLPQTHRAKPLLWKTFAAVAIFNSVMKTSTAGYFLSKLLILRGQDENCCITPNFTAVVFIIGRL
jgi:hypothetical protein